MGSLKDDQSARNVKIHTIFNAIFHIIGDRLKIHVYLVGNLILYLYTPAYTVKDEVFIEHVIILSIK